MLLKVKPARRFVYAKSASGGIQSECDEKGTLIATPGCKRCVKVSTPAAMPARFIVQTRITDRGASVASSDKDWHAT
jgi:homoaconitase/3-isopropylmalate dehydratase large subunit